MALKDWKKTEEWKDYLPSVTWHKSKYVWVQVWKTGLPLKEMKRRGHRGIFIFQASDSTKKYFKTKSQALAYAREYMRKN